jgi:hypothetical protein
MSAGSHSFVRLGQSPDLLGGALGGVPGDVPGDVMGDLLHALSQPLTGLRCSLELALDPLLGPSPEPSVGRSLRKVAKQQQDGIVAALQQTEKVIGMVQLMREYVNAGRTGPAVFSTALQAALRSLIEELSSVAAVRDVQVRLAGSCTAIVPVPEARLRLALQYLITAEIEAQPAGGRVLLALTESPAGTVLRVEGGGVGRAPNRPNSKSTSTSTSAMTTATTTASTLRRVKRAIASRVLETAGASLVCRDGGSGSNAGFVLRIPPRAAPGAACKVDGASPLSTAEAFYGMVEANPDANTCRAGPGS